MNGVNKDIDKCKDLLYNKDVNDIKVRIACAFNK